MLWDAGTATGLGPFPGIDPLEATRIAFSELLPPRGLPFLPELPARGVGADAVGRTAGLLAGLHVEVGTGVWRVVAPPRRGEDPGHPPPPTPLAAPPDGARGGSRGGPIRAVSHLGLA